MPPALTHPFHALDFLVTAAVRNCASSLEAEVDRIGRALAPVAKRIRWLFVESDSDDDTCAKLGALSASIPGFRFISLGALKPRMPSRTQRIAHSRNVYLHELRTNPDYADIDHVAIADMDGATNLLTPEAVISCWARDDWDVCTANQRGPYYDVWALRHPVWSPNDCWAQFRFLRKHGIPPKLAAWGAVYSRMISIAADSPWIEVDSAFGGFAIYRRHSLQIGLHLALDAENGEICEHLSLHQTIRGQGMRIMINPALIDTGVNEHSAPALRLTQARSPAPASSADQARKNP